MSSSSTPTPAASPFPSIFIPPSIPGDILQIANDSQPGVYVIGSDRFPQDDIDLTNFARRTLTSFDDILLSILSLIAIILCTQFICTILLRTSVYSPISTPTRLFSSVLLTEFLQLRFPFRFIIDIHQCYNQYYQTRSSSNFTPAKFPAVPIAIITFLTGCGLFVLYICLIFLTYPRAVYSTAEQYALVGVQPVVVNDFNLALNLFRKASNEQCITPSILSNYQVANSLGNVHSSFNLRACIHYSEDVTETDSISSELMTISSAFHQAGSDHNLTVGNRTISLRSRVYLSVYSEGDSEKISDINVRFRTRENDTSFSNSRYLHHLVVHESKRFACQEYLNNNSNSESALEALCSNPDTTNSTAWDTEQLPISLWPGVVENVITVSSTFDVSNFSSPFSAFHIGVASLMSGGVILQTNSLDSNGSETEASGLMVQWSPYIGVALFSIIDAILIVVVMFGLNWILQPVSLSRMAWKYAQRNRFLYVNSFLKYLQQKQQRKEQHDSFSRKMDIESLEIDENQGNMEENEPPAVDRNDNQSTELVPEIITEAEAHSHRLSRNKTYVDVPSNI